MTVTVFGYLILRWLDSLKMAIFVTLLQKLMPIVHILCSTQQM